MDRLAEELETVELDREIIRVDNSNREEDDHEPVVPTEVTSKRREK